MTSIASTPTHPAVRVATAGWLAVSAVTLAVWLIVGLAHGGLDAPWFLYSVAGGAVVVFAVRTATRGQHRQESGIRTRRDESS